MATSKTLTPTNVTISIPAMTDAPDQSVNSNCIDKLGDAVNTLNSQKTNRIAAGFAASNTGTTVFNISGGARFLVAVIDSTSTRCGLYIVQATAGGVVSVVDIKSASGITFTTGTNTLTLTTENGTSPRVMFLTAYDNLPASQHVSM